MAESPKPKRRLSLRRSRSGSSPKEVADGAPAADAEGTPRRRFSLSRRPSFSRRSKSEAELPGPVTPSDNGGSGGSMRKKRLSLRRSPSQASPSPSRSMPAIGTMDEQGLQRVERPAEYDDLIKKKSGFGNMVRRKLAYGDNRAKLNKPIQPMRAEPLDSDSDFAKLCSRLRAAAVEGDLDAVKEALDEGADIHSTNPDGVTALHWASAKGNDRVVNYLLQKGADPNRLQASGNTSVHAAAYGGHAKCLRLLLSRGGYSSSHNFLSGNTPVHDAARKGRIDCLRVLVDYSADIYTKSADGFTPLHYACDLGREECAMFLARIGVDCKARTRTGVTPIEMASSQSIKAELLTWSRYQLTIAVKVHVDKRGLVDNSKPLPPEFFQVHLTRHTTATDVVRVVKAALSKRNIVTDATSALGLFYFRYAVDGSVDAVVRMDREQLLITRMLVDGWYDEAYRTGECKRYSFGVGLVSNINQALKRPNWGHSEMRVLNIRLFSAQSRAVGNFLTGDDELATDTENLSQFLNSNHNAMQATTDLGPWGALIEGKNRDEALKIVQDYMRRLGHKPPAGFCLPGDEDPTDEIHDLDVTASPPELEDGTDEVNAEPLSDGDREAAEAAEVAAIDADDIVLRPHHIETTSPTGAARTDFDDDDDWA